LVVKWTRIREHGRSDPPEVVFKVVLKTGETDFGWTLFGVERLKCIGR
jgi:hypothetical protein